MLFSSNRGRLILQVCDRLSFFQVDDPKWIIRIKDKAWGKFVGICGHAMKSRKIKEAKSGMIISRSCAGKTKRVRMFTPASMQATRPEKLMTSHLGYFLDLVLFCNVSHYESAYNMISSS